MGEDSPSDHEEAQLRHSGRKFRRTLSCLNCQKRKVKCDRVKPCRACCTRGAPSECEYGTTKKDRHFIEQSDLIERLRSKCKQLEGQLTDAAKDGIKTSGADGKQMSRALPNRPARAGPLIRPLAMKGNKDAESKEDDTKSMVPMGMDAGKMVLEIFLSELVEAFDPGSEVYYGIGFDMHAAAELRAFSPLLSRAFEAASLAFIGERDQHPKIEAVANAEYSGVLKLLQKAVDDPMQRRSTEVLAVVVLFTIIEAFKQSTKNSILKHQQGGLELMRLRTPYRHREGFERSLYVGLRSYWVTSAIVSRGPTFLAEKEWKTIPWPEDGAPKDILHHLLDVAVDIPGYLSAFDTFKAGLKGGTIVTPDWISATHIALWEQANDLDCRLQFWETIHANTYPGGLMQEVSVDTVGPIDDDSDNPFRFPLFQCRDMTTGELKTPLVLMYPDLLLAYSMIMYWAFRLVLPAVDDSGLIPVLTPQERYEVSCHICRSMTYLVPRSPGMIVSRVMFPLRMAFDTFSYGTVEKRFIGELFRYIGYKFRFPVFMNSCTDSALAERESS